MRRCKVGQVIQAPWGGTRKFVDLGWLLMVFERIEAGWVRVA